jgi:hypothetical protein
MVIYEGNSGVIYMVAGRSLHKIHRIASLAILFKLKVVC